MQPLLRETAAAARLGIAHIDFAMSDRRPLSGADATRLVALMRAAPKPLLIYCRAGSDRTGPAAALYLASVDGIAIERYATSASPYRRPARRTRAGSGSRACGVIVELFSHEMLPADWPETPTVGLDPAVQPAAPQRASGRGIQHREEGII